MNKYKYMEIAILSCILQKPELMEQTILEDKYFIKHKKIWLFMKAFYKKFKNFDFTLMMAVSKNKYRMIEYIIWLIEQEPAISLFHDYEKELIYLFEENEKEKIFIDDVYKLANDLLVRNIDVNMFMEKINKKYNNLIKEEK